MGKKQHESSSLPSPRKLKNFATAKKRKASMNTLEAVNPDAGAQREKCKRLGHEIEEIFATAKKRKASMNTLETVNPVAGAHQEKCKRLGHEIEEIFANAKKKKASMTTLDSANPDAGAKRSKAKKKDETKKEKTFRDPPSLPRKRTGDGLVVYTAEELGVGKADAGGTQLCPFDCDCCF